jgi:hypothetical protein
VTAGALRRINVMRRLPPSVSAVAGFAAVLAAAASVAAASAPSPWVSAPAGTAARASDLAAAALGEIRLPAGAERLAQAPRGLLAALSEPNLTYPYASFERVSGYWTVPSAAAAASVLAQTPAGAGGGTSSWGTGPAAGRGVEWTLRLDESWIGPRLLAVGAIADHADGSRWLLVATAVVVWTPRRLELPAGVASVSVRALGGGARLASVTDAKTVARIVAAVDGLDVDDAVHAIYPCPEQPAGQVPGFGLIFAAASGATVATASTQACPEDLLLAVPGHGSQRLILGNLRDELEAILSRTLPAP